MDPYPPIVIGIDIGTCCTSVGVCKVLDIEVVPNFKGNNTAPTCISFDNNLIHIGAPGKDNLLLNPKNTIIHVKRIIGKKFIELTEDDKDTWPFVLVNIEGKPHFEVEFGGKKLFSPEEIYAMILMKMKETAETYLDKTVKKTMLSVPAHFRDSQRQAVHDAGVIAGLEVVGIVNEQTAMALTYATHNVEPIIKFSTAINVLLFDFGGGSLNVTVIAIKKQNFKIKSTVGDSNLGGIYFDNMLLKMCLEKFKEKEHCEVKDTKAIIYLRNACERAKIELSSNASADIHIDSFFNGKSFHITIERSDFDQLCNDSFLETLKTVKKALGDSFIDKSKIDDIVLAGGSSRIPRVRSILTDFFGGQELNTTINTSDGAVAFGAAIHGSIASGHYPRILINPMLREITPNAVSVKINEDLISVIEKNSSIPTSVSVAIPNVSEDNQVLDIQIFEGNDDSASLDNEFGKFCLSGIIFKPKCNPKIHLNFHIDICGLITFTAIQFLDGEAISLEINNEKGLGIAKKLRMSYDIKLLLDEDKKERDRLECKQLLEKKCLLRKSVLENSKNVGTLSPYKLSEMKRKLRATLQWIQSNPRARKEEYETQRDKIERAWASTKIDQKK